jgi:hypothetical protein
MRVPGVLEAVRVKAAAREPMVGRIRATVQARAKVQAPATLQAQTAAPVRVVAPRGTVPATAMVIAATDPDLAAEVVTKENINWLRDSSRG